MIVVQMALSTALLVAAGLFLRSLVNVSRVDLGIKIDHLMTFTLVPIQSGYSGAAGRALAIRIEDALRAAPGVEIASVSTIQLIGGSGSSTSDIGVEGVPPDESSRHLQADYTAVGPRFFGTIGMPLVAGREFNEGDAINSAKVVIVNERFVKTFAPGIQVIGRRFGPHLDKEIVGVVRDAKYEGVKADTPPVFYTAYRQDASLRRATFYVRTPLAPESIAATIRATVKSVDPKISVHDLRTMSDQVRENITSDRIVTTLAASFALIATLLASVGLYGVLAYTVTQRTREFGVRIALGATPAQVRQIVLANVGRLVLVGGVSGLLLAAFGGRYVRSLLFEVAPIDPSVFAVVGLLLALVALAAGFAPAWRASRIDPMITLRQE
jgi:predicted permease